MTRHPVTLHSFANIHTIFTRLSKEKPLPLLVMPSFNAAALLRGNGFVEIDLEHPRSMSVLHGEKPPWDKSYHGLYFWNYTQVSALRGRLSSNICVFTRTLLPDGKLQPLPVGDP